MQLNEMYLEFLSAIDSTDEHISFFSAEFQSVAESWKSDIEASLDNLFDLTGFTLPTVQNVTSSRYYAEYGNNEVRVTIDGNGLDKLFGGAVTTGTLSVWNITVEAPAKEVSMKLSGDEPGITVDLNTGTFSGKFNAYHFDTPWFSVDALGTLSVSGSSIISQLNIEGALNEFDITYPENGVEVSLLGKIEYYQDALGNMTYSGQVTEAHISSDIADFIINGDLSLSGENGVITFANNQADGILSISNLAFNYPAQNVSFKFTNSLSGISSDLTGKLEGVFEGFHFASSLITVDAVGNVTVSASAVDSELSINGYLEELSITQPDKTFDVRLVGNVTYSQNGDGEMEYSGTLSEMHLQKESSSLVVKGDLSASFNESSGLDLSGNITEVNWNTGHDVLECLCDISIDEVGDITSADISSLVINGELYDASTVNVKDLFAKLVGNDGMIFIDSDGNWQSDATLDALFTDLIDSIHNLVDSTAPTFVSANPAGDALGIPVNSNIVLTFSEDITLGSSSVEVHKDSVTGALVNADLMIAGDTLTINPTDDLTSGTQYFVTFASGSIKDLIGNDYAGTDSYNFKTNSQPTGSITITGTATEEQTLTANITALADADGLGTLHYQWKAAGVNIDGATDVNYVLTHNEVNKAITVEVSYEDTYGTAEGVTSISTIAVAGLQEGFVQDGYLANALVWVDGDNDGVRDWDDTNLNSIWDDGEGEAWTFTDSVGHFDPIPGNGTLRIAANPSGETIDISTRLPFTGSFSAPSGSTVINPLTTMLVAAGGNTANVLTALGLDPAINIDLTTYDPLAAASAAGTTPDEQALAIQMQSKAIQIANIMDIAVSAVVDYANVANPNLSEMMDRIAISLLGATDLADKNVIENAINEAANTLVDLGDERVAEIAEATAAVNSAIEDISSADAQSPENIDLHESMTRMVAAQMVAQKTLSEEVSKPGLITSITSENVNLLIAEQLAQVNTLRLSTITDVNPDDGATNVDVASDLVFTFSDAMQRGSGKIEIHRDSYVGTIIESYEASTSTNLTLEGNTLTVNPTNNLAYSSHYFVTFEDGSLKNILGDDFAWTDDENYYDITTGANPYVENDGGSDGISAGAVLAGVGGLGLLAWAIL